MGSYKGAEGKNACVGLLGAPEGWLSKFQSYAVRKQGGMNLEDRNERRQFGWNKTALRS